MIHGIGTDLLDAERIRSGLAALASITQTACSPRPSTPGITPVLTRRAFWPNASRPRKRLPRRLEPGCARR